MTPFDCARALLYGKAKRLITSRQWVKAREAITELERACGVPNFDIRRVVDMRPRQRRPSGTAAQLTNQQGEIQHVQFQ
jgi:hypothetical protein